MSDEAKDFHDDWRKFLNEEEELEELFGRAGAAQRQALANKGQAALKSTAKGAAKQFRDAGSTIASKVGAGHHGQLSFKDQEAAWKGMSNKPDWTKNPDEVKKQYVIANNKNLAILNDLRDWMITLKGMAEGTGVNTPIKTMDGLAYWWMGRSHVSKADQQRWASLESKAKIMADAWPKDANKIELGEDGESVVFVRAPVPSFPGAIDVLVMRYLNSRYKGKSYAAIEKDWRTGVSELEEALMGSAGTLYNKEDGLLGGKTPYRDPARGLNTAAKKVIIDGMRANPGVEEPERPQWPPSEATPEEEPPEEIDLAAEGIGDTLEREAAELLISESDLAELSLPSFGRKKKKKCPITPRKVLKHEFKLNVPAGWKEKGPLVSMRSLEEGFDAIPSLYDGMKEMWSQQNLNPAQMAEAEEAYKIFEPKLKIAFVSRFDGYVKFLIKLWKDRLDETFRKYEKLRIKADKLKCKREAAGEGGEGGAPTPEEVPTPAPVRESVEDRWKRLALL